MGWHIYGGDKISPKSVVAVVPHTSYWDGIIGYIALRSLGVNFRVISAEWLFFFPFKYVMKYILKAFPVGKNSGNAITQSVRILKENDNVNLVICPEGQLAPTDKWNPGFYIIAKKADVPVNMVAFDYASKHITINCWSIEDTSGKEMLRKLSDFAKDYAVAKYPNKFMLHNYEDNI